MNEAKDSSWPVRGALLVGVLGIAVLLGGFGTWAAFSNIAGAVVASGQIEVDRNRQVVQHIDGGVVADILVDEGDLVAEGQTLLRLDPADLRSELTITEGQLFELMARRGRLEAERDEVDDITFSEELLQLAQTRPEVAELVEGQSRLFEARRESVRREVEQLEKRASQIENQIVGIKAQQAATREQLQLIKEELGNQQSLFDRGLAQASVVLNLRRNEANLQGTLGELIASEAQAEGRITELEIETLKLNTQRREEAITRVRDLRYQELELIETRRSLRDRLSRLEITAPVSGIVYGMTVRTPRSVIRPADPVLYLVPQDRPLVIAAQIEPIHIDQTHVGQEVTLRFSALDQRTTPELFGTVTQISADAFTNEQTSVSYYRAEIILNEGEAEKLPEGSTLIPGMPVEAFLRTADRTPLAYLVKPFTDYFSKAFRES